MTRSRPIRMGPAGPDLIVTNIATTPAQPAVGEPVAVTVTVTIRPSAAAAFPRSIFTRARGPASPRRRRRRAMRHRGTASGASAQCAGTVTYPAAGTSSAWAQVDTGQAVVERTRTTTYRAADDHRRRRQADRRHRDRQSPRRAPRPATSRHRHREESRRGGAVQSKTRYYLSIDGAKDAADTLLTGSVRAPRRRTQSAGTVTVTIPPPRSARTTSWPAPTTPRSWPRRTKTNNCLATAATIVVGRPDLVETAVTNPPAAARPGMHFAVTDTARNQGVLTAGASTTRYYLWADSQKSLDDKLLTGARSVAVAGRRRRVLRP